VSQAEGTRQDRESGYHLARGATMSRNAALIAVFLPAFAGLFILVKVDKGN
jgi:hypothetical protein